MRHKRIILTMTLMILVLVSGMSFAAAVEPKKPAVDRVFDVEKEAKIKETASLSTHKAFERLKGADFMVNEDLLNKAIYQSFRQRKGEAISLSLNYLKSPVTVSRSDDFYVAKKVLQVFPDEAIGKLKKLYQAGDATTKGNVIRAVGNLAGGPDIQDLLISALEDKTVSGEEDPEVAGDPLRICDEAYNQLVLRYKVKNVLRTIGTGHRVEVRDYHIGILKDKLKDLL
ncbi:MAG: hypothetical protein A2Y81_01050 [Nitrospirae bacterium RBG_13_43_8]|nr:MAG: hypothetical protein A2Y81_01050 [Nitrospirae bacterium RBG_13_43_8]